MQLQTCVVSASDVNRVSVNSHHGPAELAVQCAHKAMFLLRRGAACTA